MEVTDKFCRLNQYGEKPIVKFYCEYFVYSLILFIFASFIPTLSGDWVGRRHIGKRH